MASSDYYQKQLFLAKVDKDNAIIGKVERWQAHKEAILHRGYTVILTFGSQLVVQKRKHPVFNKNYDLSFSSHQIYKGSMIQTDLEAIFDGLKREWNISEKDLVGKPVKIGQIYYKAKDPNSIYFEHEIDMIYQANLKNLPRPNLDYCFGFALIDKEKISLHKPSGFNFTPWVDIMIKNNLVK